MLILIVVALGVFVLLIGLLTARRAKMRRDALARRKATPHLPDAWEESAKRLKP